MEWRLRKGMLIIGTGEPSKKIAAFDLDGTIIKTKSGNKFPRDCTDWVLWDNSVREKLQQLSERGYRIVVFTNQAAIGKEKISIKDFVRKIGKISDKLGVELQVFAAIHNDHYRKPFPAMWDYMMDKNGDTTRTFYCGDAAGRKGDFADSDRAFAHNIGVSFHTPEEYFLGESPRKWKWSSIDPTVLPREDEQTIERSRKQEMIILVGRPASGKSEFCNKYFGSYVRINRDTLGTIPKCKKACTEALLRGESVIIDNTNPSVKSRAEFIALADCPVRCIIMGTSPEVSNHLNHVRVAATRGRIKEIPVIAYRTFDKNYEKPRKREGFSEIITADFVVEIGDDEDDFRKIFHQRY